MPLTRITGAAIADGTVVAADIADGTVTSSKIASGAVGGNNIGTSAVGGNNITLNAISGNLIGIAAVSGNNITTNLIRANNIVAGQITGNLFGATSISGNNITTDAIRGNNIVAGQITGNLIGTGAISSNHYAGGGVTSDVLAPNLKISLARALEVATVSSTAAGGNVNIDLTDSLIHFLGANTTSATTFNLRGSGSLTFNSMVSDGQAVSVVIAVRHGTTRHAANIAIDGAYITNDSTPYATGWKNSIYYTGGVKPTTVAISAAELNVFTYTIIKVSSGVYTVLAGNTIFQI